jgi:hypothetical protein
MARRGDRPPVNGFVKRRRPRITSGNVIRLLVFVALAAFLLYYVGPRNIAETSLKVALAVVLTVAVWVGANLLFDQGYDHWTRFNTIVGAVLGFVGALVAESNGSLKTLVDQPVRPIGSGLFDTITGWSTRPFDINSILWGLTGVPPWLVMFCSARRNSGAHGFLAVGFTGFDFSSPSRRRLGVQIDWGCS